MNVKGQGGSCVCLLPRAVPVQLGAAPTQNLHGNIPPKNGFCFKGIILLFAWLICPFNYYRPQTKFAKVMFLQVSVILSTGGACVVAPGGCMVAPAGGGHAWLLQGGMRGCSGGGGMHGCSRGVGGAWLLQGACMVAPGGVCGFFRGVACVFFSRGACVVFPMRYGQWAGGTHPTGMHSCSVRAIKTGIYALSSVSPCFLL